MLTTLCMNTEISFHYHSLFLLCDSRLTWPSLFECDKINKDMENDVDLTPGYA